MVSKHNYKPKHITSSSVLTTNIMSDSEQPKQENEVNKHEQPREIVITSQSPHYLCPSNGPGAIITSVKFDGKNYDLCEKTIKNALKSQKKKKLSFINESIQKPDGSN